MKLMKSAYVLTLMTLLVAPTLAVATPHDGHDADGWDATRPDSHAPLSVMGDHTHRRGEWMLSYRYMHMDMEGNRSGTDSLTTAEVLQSFPVAPLDMHMEMHMLGAMYAPSDRLTLMLMVPFLELEMEHQTRMGVNFTTSSEHVGDISLSALYQFFEGGRSRAHFNLGMSFPTGSIDHTDATPMAAVTQLPYPMQTGSGTYALLPGITWLGQAEYVSYGAQLKYRSHLDENDRNYTPGDRLDGVAWIARPMSSALSLSASITYADWQNYDGADTSLNPMMVPTARADLRAGTRIDGGLGLNLKLPKGHRLALDFSVPVHQDLVGPQLENDLNLTLGWQKSF